MSQDLSSRLETLARLTSLAPGRLAPDVLARVEATSQRAAGRLARGTSKTVAALAGATGSGKSSMLNAIAGRPIAAVSVRRPTTSSTQGVAFSAAGVLDAEAAELLDWLQVADRHAVTDGQLDGLILLDLPDHDSTAAAHRQEVDRLVPAVDTFVWIVDPQKYADALLHQEYLERLAGHADVTLVVLNQLDTLDAADRRAALEDLSRLLGSDGLDVAGVGVLATLTRRTGGVRVFGASARSGEGIAELRSELGARVAERRAMITRIEADVDWIASDLAAAVGDHPPRPLDRGAVSELGAALARAVGAEGIAAAVASSHERSGRVAVGWPPTRWLARLRPDPLRRLGLRPGSRAPAAVDGRAPVVERASLDRASPVADAAVSGAIRTLAGRASAGLPERWQQRIVDAARSRRADLDDALDRAVSGAELWSGRPAWWRPVGALQWLLAAAMAAGLLWLLVLGAFGWLQLPDVPTPEVGRVPWPTLLAVGGAAAGLLLAVVARWANGLSAHRRAARARAAIAEAALGVADDLVVTPVAAELHALADLHTLCRDLRR